MIVQFLIRLELLLLSWIAHVHLSISLEVYFDKQKQHPSPKSTASISQLISNYYLLITAVQFHLPFYSSRLLPNTFATILVVHAYAEWFKNNPRRAAAYLVFTTAIFRCDVLLLLFTIGLTMLIRREFSIIEAFTTGVVTGLVSLLVTIPLDSLLWGRLIWPEFEVWWFNAVENKSSEWGTMPYHWYLTKALPKGMLLTAFLVRLAFVRLPEYVCTWTRQQLDKDKTTKQTKEKQSTKAGILDLTLLPFFTPTCGFIILYSFLPHKEIRFIFPAIPMFNVCAAYGMSRLHRLAFANGSQRKHTLALIIARGMYLCGAGALIVTLLGSMIFVRLSRENYPGGVALDHLKHYLETSLPPDEQSTKWQDVHVHIDVAAAMTGVSLFGQRYVSYRYLDENEQVPEAFRIDKSGYEEENSLRGAPSMVFTHLLTESQQVSGYHVVETIQGHPRIDIRNFRIETQDAIYIMERDGWRH